jgi:mRNA interferase MazF
MHRGDIWLVRLDPTVGAEIGKTRPAIVVSDDRIGILPLKVVVPITEWQTRYTDRDWMVQLNPSTENGLSKRSAADAFQVSSVSTERFVAKLGRLSEEAMKAVNLALALVIALDSEL